MLIHPAIHVFRVLLPAALVQSQAPTVQNVFLLLWNLRTSATAQPAQTLILTLMDHALPVQIVLIV